MALFYNFKMPNIVASFRYVHRIDLIWNIFHACPAICLFSGCLQVLIYSFGKTLFNSPELLLLLQSLSQNSKTLNFVYQTSIFLQCHCYVPRVYNTGIIGIIFIPSLIE
jgi:hypothetical protein